MLSKIEAKLKNWSRRGGTRGCRGEFRPVRKMNSKIEGDRRCEFPDRVTFITC